MNHWKYLGKILHLLENIPQDVIGFVYKITNTPKWEILYYKMFLLPKNKNI